MDDFDWYTTNKYQAYKPPQQTKQWVGLTDDERRHYNNRLSGSGVAEEIEAKLKEKNA